MSATERQPSVFERYTERARRAVFYARYEAAHSGPPIEPEHLLLGIIRDDGGMMRGILAKRSIEVGDLQRELESLRPARPEPPVGMDIPLSGRSMRALELAERESAGGGYLGVEHILVGILLEGGSAATVLQKRGLDATVARHAIMQLLKERSNA